MENYFFSSWWFILRIAFMVIKSRNISIVWFSFNFYKEKKICINFRFNFYTINILFRMYIWNVACFCYQRIIYVFLNIFSWHDLFGRKNVWNEFNAKWPLVQWTYCTDKWTIPWNYNQKKIMVARFLMGQEVINK